MVPEMEAFAKAYGFRFVCHARGHSDRKAGEERSFFTVETNFLPGRSFENLEDLNRPGAGVVDRAHGTATSRQGWADPGQAFEHELGFLRSLPPHLPAPYKVLERTSTNTATSPWRPTITGCLEPAGARSWFFATTGTFKFISLGNG